MANSFPDTAARAGCDIAISCAGCAEVHTTHSEAGGGLSLEPGAARLDDLACLPGGEALSIPSCVTAQAAWVDVALEEPCGTACTGPESIHTGTAKGSDTATARPGDTVNYTVTFTNYSATHLDAVRIADSIPAGMALVPESIRPAPAPGETLQTGVSVGGVAPGGWVALTYSATVDAGYQGSMVNCARAEYLLRDCRGCVLRGVGGAACHTVEILPCMCHCRCQCVPCRFCVADFRCIRQCYVHQISAECRHTPTGPVVRAWYGVVVRYLDRCGQPRGAEHIGRVDFPVPACPQHFRVRLVELCCDCGCGGRIAACFRAELCAEFCAF